MFKLGGIYLIYCISDIHGKYTQYKALLEKVNFNDNDILFVLGDVLDRGPNAIKVLQDMMSRLNVYPIIGNHEYMAMYCFKYLMKEITEESIEALDEEILLLIQDWFSNGGETTYKEFVKLSPSKRQDILDYLEEFTLYEEIEVNGKSFVLCHGGIGNFNETKPLEEYSLFDMAFNRPDYSKVYFSNKYLVTGHTPTPLVDESCEGGKIYQQNNHIAIDCGAVFGGQLGMICLDTFETFYVK